MTCRAYLWRFGVLVLILCLLSVPDAARAGDKGSKSTNPFSDAQMQVPILSVYAASGQSIAHAPKPWDSALVNIDVSHLATGSGPDISSDQHFREDSVEAFQTAAAAAAEAVGYDEKYLRARLYLPRPAGLDMLAKITLDGQSAGIAYAVAIAAALLGDTLRYGVCLSGTINLNQEVGPVGGLEDKIKACRDIKYRQLIFPLGQSSMGMILQGKSYDIALTEVKTLAEAYQAATGQSLRRIPQK